MICVVGEDLEQERLELVVGAVDLVDQQHRRRPARRWSIARSSGRLTRKRSEYSSSSRSSVPAPAASPWPRRRAGGAAGGSSPTRRRPGRRRCPRSTAGGSARRRSSAASTLATSVLPTPASPSSSSGRCSRSARKIGGGQPLVGQVAVGAQRGGDVVDGGRRGHRPLLPAARAARSHGSLTVKRPEPRRSSHCSRRRRSQRRGVPRRSPGPPGQRCGVSDCRSIW